MTQPQTSREVLMDFTSPRFQAMLTEVAAEHDESQSAPITRCLFATEIRSQTYRFGANIRRREHPVLVGVAASQWDRYLSQRCLGAADRFMDISDRMDDADRHDAAILASRASNVMYSRAVHHGYHSPF